MSRTIAFKVAGLAATAGSHKAYPVRKKDGRMGVAVTHASKSTKSWMEVVLLETLNEVGRIRSKKPWDVFLDFQFVIPDSYRTKKGLRKGAPQYPSRDVDKLARAVLDSVTGVLWLDDRQVVTLTTRKRWGDWEGVFIRAWEIDSERQDDDRGGQPAP